MGVCPPAMAKAVFDTGAAVSCSMDSDYSLYVITDVPTPDQIPKICASSACKRVMAAIKSTQPTECNTGGPRWDFKIYEQILNPIDAGCRAASPVSPPTVAPQTAPPRTEPPSTASPPAATTAALPATTTPPGTAATTTASPSTATTPLPSTSVVNVPACASVLKLRMSEDTNDNNCYRGAGYTFSYLTPAKPNDIAFICNNVACKAMIDLARSIATTECIADNEYYLYSEILNPIIRQCANLPIPLPTNATATSEAPLRANWTIAPTKEILPPTLSPSSNPKSSDSGQDETIFWIVGVIVAVVLVASIIIWLCYKRKRNPHIQRDQHLVYGHEADEDSRLSAPAVYAKIKGRGDSSPHFDPKPSAPPMSITSEPTSRGSTDSAEALSKLTLLSDAEIIAVRVPLKKIVIGRLISRGGFGEVYKGMYKDETVAIKKMLPERRTDLHQVTKFLGEIKLMASLEHERIVRFVGVAWASPIDICVLSEFMEGGDLRSLLKRYEAEHRPQGFDSAKIKIALHVAHAITYMHSLQPLLLHRDLKSSNILLSEDLDAKVTDFGVSRERVDATMTRGVGTSLWMAPEIMMGGRYDEKADIFSFGVVLSELDSNKLPYVNQVDSKASNYGELLQRVAQGRLVVDFSYESDPDLVALGRDCVALDPHDRPPAAEVLHRIHQVLRQYQH